MSYGYHRLGANARVRDGIVPGNGNPIPRMVLTWFDVDQRSAPASDTGPEQFSPPAPVVATTELGPPRLTTAQARERGYTGDTCRECGSLQMVRNGTCEKCESCGSTTGCS